jgi:hypothetical protein
MSNNENNLRSIIARYNFSRRVVDHRQHYDLNYSINRPILSKAWLGSAKNRFIGSIVYYFGAYVSGAALLIGASIVTIDALYRHYTNHPNQNLLFSAKRISSERFVYSRHDRTSELGKWNHNFNCWENEKNCGRDFDWIRK